MKTLRYMMSAFLLTVIVSSSVWAQPTVMEILKKMEEIEFIQSDGTLKMTMTVQRKDKGVQIMETVFYRRDVDDAFLMVMTGPDSEKGNGYLRVGDNMWMYRRNSRTFQKMSRYQNIASTQMNATDFEKRKFSELYEPILDENGKELLTEEVLGRAKIPVYRLEVRAIVKDLPFPKVIYWVNRETFLTMKTESYSRSGTLMTSGYFPKYHEVEGKYIPAKILMVDEFEKGNKTMTELSGVLLKPIEEDVFNKAYLESLSK